MKILLVISSIVLPIVMVFLNRNNNKFKTSFNALALLSTIIFGSIISTSIYQVIIDDEVFMTTIHALFLKPFFLMSGGYLGVYVIYRLMLLTLEEK